MLHLYQKKMMYFERDETVQWNTQIHSQEYTQRLLTTFKVGFYKNYLNLINTKIKPINYRG